MDTPKEIETWLANQMLDIEENKLDDEKTLLIFKLLAEDEQKIASNFPNLMETLDKMREERKKNIKSLPHNLIIEIREFKNLKASSYTINSNGELGVWRRGKLYIIN